MENKHHTAGIRLATYHDLADVIDIIATSFRNDPCWNWLLEKSDRKDKLMVLTRYIVEETFAKGQVYITEDLTAAALWHTEKKESFSWSYLKRNLSFLAQVGIGSTRRSLKLAKHIESNHPKNKPYLYLACIGVLPQARGNGFAKKLIATLSERYKAAKVPVFLETANGTNVKIYNKMGFELTGTIAMDDIKLYFMRDAGE